MALITRRRASRLALVVVLAALFVVTSVSPQEHSAAAARAAFRARVAPVTADQVRFTWHRGCPVPPTSLVALSLTYVGFDHRAHQGLLIVNRVLAAAAVEVFRRLYAARFPIREMVPEDAFHGSDASSMAHDNTSGFNCRDAVVAGAAKRWSMHAYGEAVDVNPVENPYVLGRVVEPAAGTAFLDRRAPRPGMAVPGGVLVAAFARVGWQWGGRWAASPDYQHFSPSGA